MRPQVKDTSIQAYREENAALREVVEKADKLYSLFVNREGDTNASEAYRLARESVKRDGQMDETELADLDKMIHRWCPHGIYSKIYSKEWKETKTVLQVQIIEFINQILSRREGKF